VPCVRGIDQALLESPSGRHEAEAENQSHRFIPWDWHPRCHPDSLGDLSKSLSRGVASRHSLVKW